MGGENCATCCAVYSVLGIVLLLLFGSMFQNGAITFAILSVKHEWEAEQKANACYSAAMMYGATLVISIVAKIVLSRTAPKTAVPTTSPTH